MLSSALFDETGNEVYCFLYVTVAHICLREISFESQKSFNDLLPYGPSLCL
jgi:hypothetical protein